MEAMERIADILQGAIVQAVIVFIIYLLVALAIFLDLWAGIRKAKARGEYRSSAGFRKTVDKFCRYYNMLLVVTVIDVLQMLLLGLLNHLYSYSVPVLPVITFLGAVFIVFIELKSVYEKNDQKEKAKVQQAAADLRRLLQDPGGREILAGLLELAQRNAPAPAGMDEQIETLE